MELQLRQLQTPAPCMPIQPQIYEFVGDVPSLVYSGFKQHYSSAIFVQELALNAIDAIRIRDDQDVDLADCERYEVRVVIDKERKLLSVEDAGVGFTEADLVARLGVPGLSGTQEYVTSRPYRPWSEPIPLFGRHGLGFYSSIAVSDKVRVVTKSREGPQLIWETSDGSSEFTVDVDRDCYDGEIKCGTKVQCYLNSASLHYLDEQVLDPILQVIGCEFPIALLTRRVFNEGAR